MNLNKDALKKALAISLVTLTIGSLGLANEVTIELIPDSDLPAWVQDSGPAMAQSGDSPTIELLG
ncbi:MAG: hypothetical protein LBJ25_03255 [Candidatus Margulisbacteria bacterium]|nr:hypothetical protein [Candidatus Margulisiibacteriota bacterium]